MELRLHIFLNYAQELDCKQNHLVPTGIIEVDNVLKER